MCLLEAALSVCVHLSACQRMNQIENRLNGVREELTELRCSFERFCSSMTHALTNTLEALESRNRSQ